MTAFLHRLFPGSTLAVTKPGRASTKPGHVSTHSGPTPAQSNRISPASVLLFISSSVLLLPAGTRSASAQLIPIKTVPVASGDQFLVFPSQNLGMGGVGLALADTLGDPFSNPATGSRISESIFFASPTFYGISDGNGSGRTLPVGVLFTSGRWFGGGSFSLQELKGAERNNEWPWTGTREPWVDFWWPGPEPSQDLSEASARNLYAFGVLGYRLPDHGISIGVSGFYADLGAVDGVELLYAMSQEIDQSGHLSDIRLGILKEWESGQSLELTLLRNKVRMQHDVTYLNLVWGPVPPDTIPIPHWQTRVDENLDHTDTWGGHLAYRRPVGTNGWSVGWSLAANERDHPKIPNYEIQNIPRDPGETRAYALGAGVAKSEGPARFGVDLVLQPIRSETWADAPADTTSVIGGTIRKGQKTVENDFHFTNALVRAGTAIDYRSATFSLGLQIRSISYDLDQFDRIQVTKRNQEESWMEWTPSLGVKLKLAGADLQYIGRMTTGTGRPGTRWTDSRMAEAGADLAQGSSFILAPTGPLTLQDATVTTHQISVILPIR